LVKKVAKEKPIFEDRQTLLDIWKTRSNDMKFYQDAMWKSVQYFFVLISALISANLVGIGTIVGLKTFQTQFYLLVTFLIIPILVIILSFIGIAILRRRFSRFLELVAHLGKIEGLLGLSVDISERLQKLSAFQKDNYLFQRYVKSRNRYASEKEFIESELGGGIEGRNMYTDMRKAYWIFIVVGVFLISLDFFLIVYVHGSFMN
jgi:hypothetical protein